MIGLNAANNDSRSYGLGAGNQRSYKFATGLKDRFHVSGVSGSFGAHKRNKDHYDLVSKKIQALKESPSSGTLTDFDRGIQEDAQRLEALEQKLQEIQNKKAMRENRDHDRRRRRVVHQAARMIQSNFRGHLFRKNAAASAVLISFLRAVTCRQAITAAAWASRVLASFAIKVSYIIRRASRRRQLIQEVSVDTWLDVCDAVIITHSHRRAAARPKPKPKAKSKEKGGFFMTQSSSSSPEVRKSKKSLSPCRLPEELTAAVSSRSPMRLSVVPVATTEEEDKDLTQQQTQDWVDSIDARPGSPVIDHTEEKEDEEEMRKRRIQELHDQKMAAMDQERLRRLQAISMTKRMKDESKKDEERRLSDLEAAKNKQRNEFFARLHAENREKSKIAAKALEAKKRKQQLLENQRLQDEENALRERKDMNKEDVRFHQKLNRQRQKNTQIAVAASTNRPGSAVRNPEPVPKGQDNVMDRERRASIPEKPKVDKVPRVDMSLKATPAPVEMDVPKKRAAVPRPQPTAEELQAIQRRQKRKQEKEELAKIAFEEAELVRKQQQDEAMERERIAAQKRIQQRKDNEARQKKEHDDKEVAKQLEQEKIAKNAHVARQKSVSQKNSTTKNPHKQAKKSTAKLPKLSDDGGPSGFAESLFAVDENGHYYEVGGSKLISPPPKFDAGGPTTFNPPPSPHRALSNNIMSSNEKSDGSVPAASLLQASAKLKHKHPTINSVHHPFNVNQVADMKPPNPNPIAAFDKASSKKRLPLSTKDKKDDRLGKVGSLLAMVSKARKVKRDASGVNNLENKNPSANADMQAIGDESVDHSQYEQFAPAPSFNFRSVDDGGLDDDEENDEGDFQVMNLAALDDAANQMYTLLDENAYPISPRKASPKANIIHSDVVGSPIELPRISSAEESGSTASNSYIPANDHQSHPVAKQQKQLCMAAILSTTPASVSSIVNSHMAASKMARKKDKNSKTGDAKFSTVNIAKNSKKFDNMFDDIVHQYKKGMDEGPMGPPTMDKKRTDATNPLGNNVQGNVNQISTINAGKKRQLVPSKKLGKVGAAVVDSSSMSKLVDHFPGGAELMKSRSGSAGIRVDGGQGPVRSSHSQKNKYRDENNAFSSLVSGDIPVLGDDVQWAQGSEFQQYEDCDEGAYEHEDNFEDGDDEQFGESEGGHDEGDSGEFEPDNDFEEALNQECIALRRMLEGKINANPAAQS